MIMETSMLTQYVTKQEQMNQFTTLQRATPIFLMER